MSRVLVIGGGAAGLIAAWRASGLGHQVTMLEANGHLGVKIRISGGGKCNLTHEGTVPELLAAFPKKQARFLRPALYAFSNADLLSVLLRSGLQTYVRENGRVFPVDRPGSAGQVVAALEDLARQAGVAVRTGCRVVGLRGALPRLESVQLSDGTSVGADEFILATGGASYPETGTRGEVLTWLRELGVPVDPWFPALAPIPLKQPHPKWEGVALRGGTLWLSAERAGKRSAHFQGDVLFTKTGLSGPAALELSGPVEQSRRGGGAWLAYGCTGETAEAMDTRLQEEARHNPHLAARTWLQQWLPERLCIPSLESIGLLPDQRFKDLSRSGRRGMVDLVLSFPLGEPGPVPLTKGEVCSGGVRLEAVDPHRMAVKGWDNLRVCGELLDVDGPVGGYNLQAAFSTGYVAGSLE